MGNVFDNDLGKAAITRLKRFGNTNIRYEMVEHHGVEKIQKDLEAKMGSGYRVRICYESHEPFDFPRYFYCGKTSYTARIPVMPTVVLEKIKKNKN